MSTRRIFFNLSGHRRSLSTRRPPSSSGVDRPFESHLESATVRHRQSRATKKDAHRPELRSQNEPKVSRNERSVARDTPRIATDHVRTKREVKNPSTAYSTPSATDMYRANKTGMISTPAQTQTLSHPEPTATTKTTDTSTSSSSSISYGALIGVIAVAGVGVAANSSALQEQFPIFHDLLENEFLSGLLQRGENAPVLTPDKTAASDNATGKSWSIWRSKEK